MVATAANEPTKLIGVDSVVVVAVDTTATAADIMIAVVRLALAEHAEAGAPANAAATGPLGAKLSVTACGAGAVYPAVVSFNITELEAGGEYAIH
jgi:hypothetical protein